MRGKKDPKRKFAFTDYRTCKHQLGYEPNTLTKEKPNRAVYKLKRLYAKLNILSLVTSMIFRQKNIGF